MAARGETRQRILNTAKTLFQRQGYHATGLNQILAEAQAPKGSLYFHFPGGKEQLAAETITQAADEWGLAIDAALAQTPDTLSPAHAIADLLGDLLERSQFRDGCPLATVALEVAGGSDNVRAACARGYQHWTDLITARLGERGVDETAAGGLAVLVLSSIEGALLLAKVQHDTTPLHRVATQLAALIEEKISAARPAGHG